MFDEKIRVVSAEFQRRFDILRNSFVKTLSNEWKFLRRDLKEKNKVVSNLISKNLSSVLQKEAG